MNALRNLIWNEDAHPGRAFALSINALIILSLVTFSIETIPSLPAKARHGLKIIEAVIVGIFTLEYLLRIATAQKKFGYINSFFGWVDLLAILPFYLALGFDTHILRFFRLFRIVRILKIARYTGALDRFTQALRIAREELVLMLCFTLLLLYLSSVGIYFFENRAQPENFPSIPHSMWWAVSTLTTVGYGDVVPVTSGGRIFTFFLLLVCLGIVAAPAGILASAMNRVLEKEKEEQAK